MHYHARQAVDSMSSRGTDCRFSIFKVHAVISTIFLCQVVQAWKGPHPVLKLASSRKPQTEKGKQQ